MKRADLDLSIPCDVKEFLDYVEDHVNDIRDLLNIESLSHLSDIEKAYLIAKQLSTP